MRAGRLYCLRRVPYAQGLSLQAALWRAVRRGSSPPVLLALEHAPACVTLGRRADAAHVLASAGALAARVSAPSLGERLPLSPRPLCCRCLL